MNPIVLAMMQQTNDVSTIGDMPKVDPIKDLIGNLFYIAPILALTIVGLIVLIYDFTFLRKKPSAERQLQLGWTTLIGTLVAAAIQVWLMLPPSLGGDFNVAAMSISLFFGALAIDGVSCWMHLAILTLLALVIIQSMSFSFSNQWGEYYALLCWSGVGMMFLIAAEELLTLFLTLETMTLCLYMLAAFEKSRRRSAEAGLKYFVYGSVSSALFLFGLSLIYGLTGSTRLDAVRVALEAGTESVALGGLSGNVAGAAAVLLVLVGFGFKIAAVPFQQWAPDTYEGAPSPVAAWIASGSKIASFIALIKVLVEGFAPWAMRGTDTTSPGWIGIIALIAAVTMTYGNFAALAQRNLKRMLAYSSIAHAGYMLVGVLAASVSTSHASSIGPILFYLVVYGFTTVGAFAVASWLVRDTGSDEISDLDGLGYRAPMLSVCIVLLMLSLIGMPPLAGFFGKLYMFMEALNAGDRGHLPLTWLVMLGLFNSVVSAFYYVRVLKAMYLRQESGQPLRKAGPGIAIPILVATAIAVGFGVYPRPLVDAMRSASKSRTTSGPTHYRTFADPKNVTTPEQREAKAKADFERFKAEGGSAGMGGPPPKAKGEGAPGKAKGKGRRGGGQGKTTPPNDQPRTKRDGDS